ncbi:MAG: hypothetical protein Q2306_00185 [Phytoplasma sp.]|uniref:hypothetical protein n=1 Tax=Phytoplasma sp. TaxID=2155 RepID=UPI002B4056D1|nr:hypothetical protein [Phytoplasma sp.]WRH06770.1 MAG: hypothetical protein Q2306_00185 [Phytoplasma sp.]
MNSPEINNIIKEPIILEKLSIEIQNRYIKTKNKNKREWFTPNLKFIDKNKNYKFTNLIIKFDHIDEDNPEFFLQPGQFVKIIKGKIEKDKFSTDKYILTIYKFQQETEK